MTVRIKRYSEAMWGGTQADNSRVERLLEEAYRAHDVPLNEEAATRWGKENFPGGIPQSAVDECEAELERKGGDFEAMAQERLTGRDYYPADSTPRGSTTASTTLTQRGSY